MQEIILQLQQDHAFDLIIYDLPPLAACADAKILAAMAIRTDSRHQTGQNRSPLPLKICSKYLRLSHISVTLGLVAK
jgi:hypothetical protein